MVKNILYCIWLLCPMPGLHTLLCQKHISSSPKQDRKWRRKGAY